MATFGERLYILRKERRLSQEEAAHLFNIERAAYSKWEHNESFPRDKQEAFDKIASYYDVSVGYVTGETDERGKYKTDEQIAEEAKKEEEHCEYVLQRYRSLSAASRKVIDSMLEQLCQLELGSNFEKRNL